MTSFMNSNLKLYIYQWPANFVSSKFFNYVTYTFFIMLHTYIKKINDVYKSYKIVESLVQDETWSKTILKMS